MSKADPNCVGGCFIYAFLKNAETLITRRDTACAAASVGILVDEVSEGVASVSLAEDTLPPTIITDSPDCQPAGRGADYLPEECMCPETKVKAWVGKAEVPELDHASLADVEYTPGKLPVCSHWPEHHCCEHWVDQWVAINRHEDKLRCCFSVLLHRCNGVGKLDVCWPCLDHVSRVMEKHSSPMDSKAYFLVLLQQLFDAGWIVRSALDEIISTLLPEYVIAGTRAAGKAINKEWSSLRDKRDKHLGAGMNPCRQFRIWGTSMPLDKYPIRADPRFLRANHQSVACRVMLLLMLFANQDERQWASDEVLQAAIEQEDVLYNVPPSMIETAFKLIQTWLTGNQTCICQDMANVCGNDKNLLGLIWKYSPGDAIWVVYTGGNIYPPPFWHHQYEFVNDHTFTGFVQAITIRISQQSLALHCAKSAFKGDLGWLNYVYPATSANDARHMTTRLYNLCKNAYGLGLFSPAFAWSVKERKYRVVSALHFLLNQAPIGLDANRAIGIFIARLEPKSPAAKMLEWCKMEGMLHVEPNFLREVFKSITTCLRRFHAFPNGRPVDSDFIVKACYFEKVAPRAIYLAPPEIEIQERCTVTRHLRMSKLLDGAWEDPAPGQFGWPERDHLVYSLLRKKASSAGYALINKHLASQSFKEALETRHQWLASGSAGKMKIEIDGKKMHARKRAVAETLSIDEIVAYLEQRARQDATASNKLELDRDRLLLAAAFIHYLINSYATCGMEANMSRLPGIEKGVDTMVQRAMEYLRQKLTSDEEYHMLMLDYANFNIHHTPEAMQQLFLGLADTAKALHCHVDFIKALNWTAESMLHSYIDFSGVGVTNAKPLKAVQGMFSGTRSTDLINSLFNLFYYQIAAEIMAKRWGINLGENYHVHQGDDSFIASKKATSCALLYYTFRAMGCALQPIKQDICYWNSEFLRVYGMQFGSRGFLWRAVGTLIEKQVQSADTLDPVEAIKALHAQIYVLLRRGMSKEVATLLYEDQLELLSHVRPLPGAIATCKIPRWFIYAPTWRGGLGCPPPGCESAMNWVPLKPIISIL